MKASGGVGRGFEVVVIDGGGDEGQVLSCPRGSGREWKICLAPTDKGVYGVVSRGGLGGITYGR